MSGFRVGQVWLASGGMDRWRVVAVGPKIVTMWHEKHGNYYSDTIGSWSWEMRLVEDVPPEPDERAARVALEERLDKVERARVYAEDQARHCRSELEAERRKVESLRQSVAARDEKERGKVRRQADTIKALEERNAKLVEKVAAQWARAEEAKTLASDLRAEVQRLATVVSHGTTGDPAVRDEIVRLQGIVADHERWRRSISLLFFRHGRDETPWEWIRERVDSAGDVLVALRAYARGDVGISRVLEALREHDRKGAQ